MFEWVHELALWSVLRAALLALAGLVISHIVSRALTRFTENKFGRHEAALVGRGSFYIVLTLFAVMVLRELGFSLTVVLGAAGILTVAIGFASQTSASNIISGLFLIGEKPFRIGDTIQVGETMGEVLSIDLLSVKLRTFDNVLVRLPNEQLIKSEVATLTKFPIRRLDLDLGVAYKEDLAKVRETLFEVAEKNPFALDAPEPIYRFLGFGDSSLEIRFCVWVETEKFWNLRSSIREEIKVAFDAAGIEIPFPHRSLYAGSVTNPFPVKVVDGSQFVENVMTES